MKKKYIEIRMKIKHVKIIGGVYTAKEEGHVKH